MKLPLKPIFAKNDVSAEIVMTDFPRILRRAMPGPLLKQPAIDLLGALRRTNCLPVFARERGIKENHVEFGHGVAGLQADRDRDVRMAVSSRRREIKEQYPA